MLPCLEGFYAIDQRGYLYPLKPIDCSHGGSISMMYVYKVRLKSRFVTAKPKLAQPCFIADTEAIDFTVEVEAEPRLRKKPLPSLLFDGLLDIHSKNDAPVYSGI